MKTISDEDYEEYIAIKKWANTQEILKSAKSIENLEDDIDLPIKKCVAMLALLGCKPIYSCCGFDYDGQLFHKSHQYGRPYFVLTANNVSNQFIEFLMDKKTLWYVGQGNHPTWINLELMSGMNPHWRKEECIHFYEECLVGIIRLENILLQQTHLMTDTYELIDTNYLAKRTAKHWQYPPKNPWMIQKNLLDTY